MYAWHHLTTLYETPYDWLVVIRSINCHQKTQIVLDKNKNIYIMINLKEASFEGDLSFCKMQKKIVDNPLSLVWTLWWERNRKAFENCVTSAQRTKATFLSNLWSWANLYSVDNTNYLLDFLTWLGCR